MGQLNLFHTTQNKSNKVRQMMLFNQLTLLI